MPASTAPRFAAIAAIPAIVVAIFARVGGFPTPARGYPIVLWKGAVLFHGLIRRDGVFRSMAG